MTTGTVANPLAPGIVPVSSTSMNSTIFVDSKDTVKTVSSEDESSPSAEDEQNTIIHRPSHEHNTIDNNNESDEMAFLATEEERIMKQDEEKKEAEVFPDKCISSRNTNEADQTNGKTANNNLSLKRVKIVEPVKDSEEGAVPVKMEEDNIEKVTQLTGRSRIDSIDLDCECIYSMKFVRLYYMVLKYNSHCLTTLIFMISSYPQHIILTLVTWESISETIKTLQVKQQKMPQLLLQHSKMTRKRHLRYLLFVSLVYLKKR